MGKHYESDKEKLYKAQIGQQATVQRTSEKSDAAKEANRRLHEIGALTNPLPENLEYMGSAATHIYYNKTLSQAFFVNQVQTLGRTHELLAQSATKDLIGTIMEYFGKRRPKLRSGF